jgi:altered-inheritance-of-mitochondria protein 13
LSELQGQDGRAAAEKLRDLSRESIQREITTLKTKLEGRKKVEDLDRGVEKAKSEVVQCLRANDRRPLDCWKEVENFRREVSRLEQAFVDRALR